MTADQAERAAANAQARQDARPAETAGTREPTDMREPRFLCGGCDVREPWEHRCHHPQPCDCSDCDGRWCECLECLSARHYEAQGRADLNALRRPMWLREREP